MVNLAIAYAGPDPALLTLTKELTTRFGTPKRWYEFVTGYKSASNVSGHNADNQGRAHAVDIFVGPGQSISTEQGIDLAERLRAEGSKGSIAGHPDRLAYIIHRGRIAGDHTNWQWVAYTGADPHTDHIHISSTFDYYWGAPVWGLGTDYNSTAPWNLWVNTPAKPATPKPPTVQGGTGGPTGWTVDTGDTMTYIAAVTGVSLNALLKANPGVYPNLIYPKQKLTLPAGAKWPPNTAPKPPAKPAGKTIDQLVAETLAGKHGNGDARKKSLGANYNAVQAKINAGATSGPSISQLADAVMRGEYGNGADRQRRLGSNYAAVQAEINRRAGIR